MNSAHFTVTSFGTRAKPYPGKSAKTKSGCGFPGRRTWKKLMVCVRPGVLLVRATLLPRRQLMRLDLPTLERPTKAISGALGGGNCPGSTAEVTKRVNTFMPSLCDAGEESARAGQQSCCGKVSQRFDSKLRARRGLLFGYRSRTSS